MLLGASVFSPSYAEIVQSVNFTLDSSRSYMTLTAVHVGSLWDNRVTHPVIAGPTGALTQSMSGSAKVFDLDSNRMEIWPAYGSGLNTFLNIFGNLSSSGPFAGVTPLPRGQSGAVTVSTLSTQIGMNEVVIFESESTYIEEPGFDGFFVTGGVSATLTTGYSLDSNGQQLERLLTNLGAPPELIAQYLVPYYTVPSVARATGNFATGDGLEFSFDRIADHYELTIAGDFDFGYGYSNGGPVFQGQLVFVGVPELSSGVMATSALAMLFCVLCLKRFRFLRDRYQYPLGHQSPTTLR